MDMTSVTYSINSFSLQIHDQTTKEVPSSPSITFKVPFIMKIYYIKKCEFIALHNNPKINCTFFG